MLDGVRIRVAQGGKTLNLWARISKKASPGFATGIT